MRVHDQPVIKWARRKHRLVRGSTWARYLTCIRRAESPHRFEVYPMPLRKRLPVVPVPLRGFMGEADVAIDLQDVVDRTYTAGGHDDIDYRDEPEPPLKDDAAKWADQLLREAGRR